MITLDDKDKTRFLNSVDIKDEHECWNWKASCMNSGYGQFMLRRDGKTVALSAHRTSFELFKGEIPEGKQVNHICDNKICVNPNHLYAGTQSENLYDTVKRGQHKSNNLKGIKNPKAKLSEEDIKEIRRIYILKLRSQGQLAKIYNVQQPTISCIVLGKTWKHIP